jgi:hypothetical protein
MNALLKAPEIFDDINAAIHDARCNVAIAKLTQFENEAFRLGGMARRSPHCRRKIVDGLYDIALVNSLLTMHGGELIESLFPTDWKRHEQTDLA